MVSVIIASYNEEGNIVKTTQKVMEVLPDAEIIIVDDGSTDNTLKVGMDAFKGKVKVIGYTPNKGKGNAIKVGIQNSTSDIIAQIDADLQFPAEELPRLIEPILKNEADIVFGSRFIKGSNVTKGSLTRMRRLANFVVSKFTSILSGYKLTDVNAGFKAWKKDVIEDIDFRSNNFAYEPEIAILASKKGYSIKEIPVTFKPREFGKTNVKLIREGIIIPLYLLKVKLLR